MGVLFFFPRWVGAELAGGIVNFKGDFGEVALGGATAVRGFGEKVKRQMP